jgi:hypothetical protein
MSTPSSRRRRTGVDGARMCVELGVHVQSVCSFYYNTQVL